MPEEKFVDVEPMVIVVNDEIEYTMMAYDWKGKRCITFADRAEDGLFIAAPFPPELVNDEGALLTLASMLEDEGFQLTYQPEQMSVVS